MNELVVKEKSKMEMQKALGAISTKQLQYSWQNDNSYNTMPSRIFSNVQDSLNHAQANNQTQHVDTHEQHLKNMISKTNTYEEYMKVIIDKNNKLEERIDVLSSENVKLKNE